MYDYDESSVNIINNKNDRSRDNHSSLGGYNNINASVQNNDMIDDRDLGKGKGKNNISNSGIFKGRPNSAYSNKSTVNVNKNVNKKLEKSLNTNIKELTYNNLLE